MFGRIEIGDNVFIGYGAILMPNINIRSNVIIGAGAVVTRDIPSGAIAVGSPAKVVSTIEEYYKSIESSKDNIRMMGLEDKRLYLESKFGINRLFK